MSDIKMAFLLLSFMLSHENLKCTLIKTISHWSSHFRINIQLKTSHSSAALTAISNLKDKCFQSSFENTVLDFEYERKKFCCCFLLQLTIYTQESHLDSLFYGKMWFVNLSLTSSEEPKGTNLDYSRLIFHHPKNVTL